LEVLAGSMPSGVLLYTNPATSQKENFGNGDASLPRGTMVVYEAKAATGYVSRVADQCSRLSLPLPECCV